MHPATLSSNTDSVAALVGRAAAGDTSAEEVLCLRFLPAVRAFAFRRLRARDAVDEFAQDVLVELLSALRAGAVGEPERLGGYVLGICKNLARERVRLRERRESLWSRFGGLASALEHDAPEHRGRELAQLEDCLSQLGGRARELVRLAYVEDETNAEIASRLAVSETNVRVMKHRTLKALEECMSKGISWEAA